MDIKYTFMHEGLWEEIYMEQPYVFIWGDSNDLI